MTTAELREIARANAEEAWDQRDSPDYADPYKPGSYDDVEGAYADNVTDSVMEAGGTRADASEAVGIYFKLFAELASKSRRQKSRRRNPAVRHHPDLFEEGMTRVFIPLDDMDKDEVVVLPRSAFDEDEWNKLPKTWQQEVYENSEEDSERADRLAAFLTKLYQWAVSGDSFDISHEMESFESWLNERVYSGNILEEVNNGGDADALERKYLDEGFSQEQYDAALKEVLEDQNSWDTDIDDRGGGDYSYQLEGNIYWDGGDIKGEVLDNNEPVAFESDVIEALWRMSRKSWPADTAADVYDGFVDDIWNSLDPAGKVRHADFQIYEIDTGYHFVANVNWDTVENSMAYQLEDLVPAKDLEATPPGDEERILELPDGFFVCNLKPGDLLTEGRTQGICVGDPQYGYAQAVRNEESRILSLRRPSGKPLLTFEVEMSGGIPVDVVQIKGKGNRLPGWARGATGVGKVKEHEVKLAIKVVEHLGLVPEEVDDLEPALRALREPRSNPGRRRSYRPVKTFSDPVGR